MGYFKSRRFFSVRRPCAGVNDNTFGEKLQATYNGRDARYVKITCGGPEVERIPLHLEAAVVDTLPVGVLLGTDVLCC